MLAATVVGTAVLSSGESVVGGSIGFPNSSTYTTRWMVSRIVVGGAASACFDSAARASAVASDAMVARNPDVANPVARMRPAAATWRRRLPMVETLVWRSMIGTADVDIRSTVVFAAAAGDQAGGLHDAPLAAVAAG
jgi:hypothetical protein